MSLWSPGEKPRNSLTSSLDIPALQTDQCTHRPPPPTPYLYFERVFLVCPCMCVCARVHMCVCPALVSRTWRHFGSETQLLKGIQPVVRKSFEGTQNFTRKDIFHRFCILISSTGQSGTPVFVCELCVFLRREGLRLERGALRCLLEPFCYLLLCF